MWVRVEELVCDEGQGLDHERQDVEVALSLLVLPGSLARDHRVYILEGIAKEGKQVRQVHHALGQDCDNLVDMVLHADEYVDDKLIWNVVETLLKVAYAALWMFLEHLELWVLLVQLVSDCAADNVGEHGLEGLLIAVIVLNWQHEA